MGDESWFGKRRDDLMDALLGVGCLAAIQAVPAAIRATVTEPPAWFAAALPWLVSSATFFALYWVLRRRSVRLSNAAPSDSAVRLTPALVFHLRQSGLSAATRDKPRFGVTIEVVGVDTRTFVIERFHLRASVRGGGVHWTGEIVGVEPATRIVTAGDGAAVVGRMTFSGNCEFDREIAEKLWRGVVAGPEFPHVVIDSGSIQTNVGRFTPEGLVGPMSVWTPSPPPAVFPPSPS